MTENEGLRPLCETCGAVPTRHNDYKDCEEHLQVVARAGRVLESCVYDSSGGLLAVVAPYRFIGPWRPEWGPVVGRHGARPSSSVCGLHRTRRASPRGVSI